MSKHQSHSSELIINRKSIYKSAWEHAKKHVRQYSLLLMIVIIINLVNSGFDPEAQKTMSQNMLTIFSILSVILSLGSAWFGMGFISYSLRILDNKAVVFSDGLTDINKTLKASIANILSTVFILLGYVALIVPGVIIQTRLLFVTTLILDKNLGIWEAIKNLGIWEAIKTSRSMTKWSVWSLLIINFLTGLTQILGILTLGVGLFRTVPFMNLAQTLAYRSLRDHK